jgi:hypothetical protein
MAKAHVALAYLLLCIALPVTAAAAESTRLAWSELSATHRQILSPLEADWPNLALDQRRRWIVFAERYPKLSAAEQKRSQERMRDWAKLTPKQREEARARYRALSKLTPEQRREIVRQWTESQEAQQAIPAETTPQPEAAETAQPAGATGVAAEKTPETAPEPDAEATKPPAPPQ